MKGFLFAFVLLPVFVSAQIISTVAGNGSLLYRGDSTAATAASFYYPNGVAVDALGNIYISDALNAVVRKVNTAGIISTPAGSGTPGFGGDNGPATADSAKLNSPAGLAVDILGNLYIADAGNARIRKVDRFGTITTVVGGGGSTSDGVQGTDYSLSVPVSLAFDAARNMYITDDGRIHKVSSLNIVTTIAGNGGEGFSGDDGPATAAMFNDPAGLAVDASGNLYIADKSNFRVRMINISGTITTVAGNGDGVGSGYGAYSGDYGPANEASLNFPTGVAAGSGGNIYIADRNNNRVRLLDGYGNITTIAGDGSSGFGGDGGPAVDAQLSAPGSLAVDINGNIYVADELNSRIRKISGFGVSAGVHNIPAKEQIAVYPNPATDYFTVIGLAPSDCISMYDVVGRLLYTSSVTGYQQQVGIEKLYPGTYFLQAFDAKGNTKERLTVVKY